MLNVTRTTRFKKDFKRIQKRRLNTRAFDVIVARLAADEPLDARYRDHALTGNRVGHRECHIAPDWLLIYRIEDGVLELVRTGSHTELFE